MELNDRIRQCEKAIAERRQVTRDYLAEATTLVWHMQQALVVPARMDVHFGESADENVARLQTIARLQTPDIVNDARRLSNIASIIEALVTTEPLIRDLYKV